LISARKDAQHETGLLNCVEGHADVGADPVGLMPMQRVSRSGSEGGN
jgi:hypothetical protein